MEKAIQHIKETGARDSIYIFCYCQRAIDIFVRHGWLSRHPENLDRVLGICEELRDILCVVKLVNIFGHAGITGNVIADRKAKEAKKNCYWAT